MKKYSKFLIFLSLTLTLLAVYVVSSTEQESKRILKGNTMESYVKIKGGKGILPIDNWEAVTKAESLDLVIIDTNDLKIERLIVNINLKKIKSGRKAIDSLATKVFKVDQYPEVILNLEKDQILEKNNTQITKDLQGTISLSGVKKDISIVTKIDKLDENLAIKGSFKIKLADYGIKPLISEKDTTQIDEEIEIELRLKFHK